MPGPKKRHDRNHRCLEGMAHDDRRGTANPWRARCAHSFGASASIMLARVMRAKIGDVYQRQTEHWQYAVLQRAPPSQVPAGKLKRRVFQANRKNKY